MELDLKHLLKRGALLATSNWQTVVIQFVAETTFKVVLAVPIVGAAVLVAVLLGGDVADLLRGSLRDIFTTIASTLLSEPVALVAFVTSFAVVLLGGSVLMFAVKGGTVDVLAAASTSTVPPLTTNISTDPPSKTTANAVMKATSATGSDNSVLAMVVKISRRLPCSRSARSAPSSTAMRIAAPMIGTASST